MKEYISISIIVNTIPGLGEKINEYAKNGWCIKDTIINGVPFGKSFEYIYLLERDVKIFRAKFHSEGFEDSFKDYLALNLEDGIKLAEKDQNESSSLVHVYGLDDSNKYI